MKRVKSWQQNEPSGLCPADAKSSCHSLGGGNKFHDLCCVSWWVQACPVFQWRGCQQRRTAHFLRPVCTSFIHCILHNNITKQNAVNQTATIIVLRAVFQVNFGQLFLPSVFFLDSFQNRTWGWIARFYGQDVLPATWTTVLSIEQKTKCQSQSVARPGQARP